jgi:hypothetical protein
MDVAIPVSAKRFAAALGIIVAGLVAASLGATSLSFLRVDDPFLKEVRESFVRLAWVDGEGNVPAWYSASLLLVSSGLLAVIALAQKHLRRGQVLHWVVLSLIFAFLSIDETVQLHELSIRPLQDMFGATGFLYYAWIVPAGVCVALLAVAYLRFMVRLPSRTRRLFLLAGAIYVGGAIGVEALSGQQASLHGEHNLTYHLIITAEELFEMTGIVIFIYALLDHISRQFTSVEFHVTSR